MRIRVVFALTALMAFFTLIIGAECMGITYPGKSVIGGSELIFNGLGLREATVFIVDAYVAAHNLEKPFSSCEAIVESV